MVLEAEAKGRFSGIAAMLGLFLLEAPMIARLKADVLREMMGMLNNNQL